MLILIAWMRSDIEILMLFHSSLDSITTLSCQQFAGILSQNPVLGDLGLYNRNGTISLQDALGDVAFLWRFPPSSGSGGHGLLLRKVFCASGWQRWLGSCLSLRRCQMERASAGFPALGPKRDVDTPAALHGLQGTSRRGCLMPSNNHKRLR